MLEQSVSMNMSKHLRSLVSP